MVKTLGIIFGAIIISIPVIYLDHVYGNGFLVKFFREQATGIVTTVLALNIATVTFLLGHLVSVENNIKKPLFSNTKKEIRHNIYFMAAMAALLFILTILMGVDCIWNINSFMFNPLVGMSVVVFILVFASLFEILEAIFKAMQFLGKTKDQ